MPAPSNNAETAEGDETPRTQAARRGLGGYWNMFREGYDELVNAICRPPRAEYRIEELGPREFTYGSTAFVRDDCELTNPRGLRLQGSLWHRAELPDGGAPAVVYTHGNASCRAEALQILAPVLASGASLFAFDFAGCGHSEGDYISLGWHEKDDLECALAHLRATGQATAIMLWGRSMGAVSAVLQASRDPSLAGLVLDSPFASLEQVALELVTSAPETVPGAPSVPPFLVKTALRVVAGTVKSRASFDLYKLRPVDAAKTCFVPALFGCANNDVLVRPHHSQQIHDEYAGDKNLVKFDGDHNDLRPGFFMDSATIFLKQVLLISDADQLDVPLDRDGRPLPIGAALRQEARSARPTRSLAHEGTLGLEAGLEAGVEAGVLEGWLGGSPLGEDGGGRHALAEYEEELMRQAIMASLAVSEGAPMEPLPPPDTQSQDGAADVVAGAPASSERTQHDELSGGVAATLSGVPTDANEEARLLEEAIRMSLESSTVGGPTETAAASPAAVPGPEVAEHQELS